MLTPETSTYASFDVPDLFYSGYADRKLALGSRAAWANRGEQQGRQHCLAETLVPRAVRLGAGGCEGCGAWVERFDRRGTEPFEPIEPFEPFEFFQNSGFLPRNFKNFRKFQHLLNYRRNSDKISWKSEQKSVKKIQNNEFLQNFAKKRENIKLRKCKNAKMRRTFSEILTSERCKSM